MKAILGILTICAISLPALAEQQRRGGTEAQYAAVQTFHDDAIVKFNSGDVDGAVGDYLDRLRVAHTTGMEITGRETLEESWSSAFADGKTTKPILVSEVLEMEVNGDDIGDWAYILCGYATVTVDRETNQPVGDFVNGRYIALLEMTEDGWKVLLDIDNSAIGAAPHLEAQLKAQLGL